jgi:hypothetical protein
MKSRVQINQIGYYASGAKHAFLLAEAESFDVIDSVNNEIVFSGFPERAIFIDGWGMKIFPIDFSALSLTGSFYITADLATGQTLRSGNFEISRSPYLSLMQSISDTTSRFHKYDGGISFNVCAFTTACLINSVLVSETKNSAAPLIDITESIIREIKHNCLRILSDEEFDETELASVAALAALGSWFFRKTEKSLSDRLSRSAVRAWIKNIELSKTDSLSYTENPGTLFWALCALYAATGAEDFISAAKMHIPRDPISFTPDNPSGFACISAFLHPDGADLPLRRSLKEALRVKADNLTSYSDSFYITRADFPEGSNLLLMSDAISLFMAETVLAEKSYVVAARRNLNYVMGANPLEKCFITGYGSNPVRKPFLPSDRMSADIDNADTDPGDFNIEPIAGLVVPGANADIKTDSYLSWQLSKKTPPARCYGDTKTSITSNAASAPASSLLFFASGIE